MLALAPKADVGQHRQAEVTARMLRSALLPKPDIASRIYKHDSAPRFALRCYTRFTVSWLRSLGAPTGSTFVFDWNLDPVTVEPVRGFSATVCVVEALFSYGMYS
jgi:hypothetical protein